MTLTLKQIEQARDLWREGKDTAFIAKKLYLPEFLVYNGRHYFTERTPVSLPGWCVVSDAAAHEGSPLSVPSTLGQEPEHVVVPEIAKTSRAGKRE